MFAFESKALRSYWSIHIEAWLKSGVNLTRYCHEHHLWRPTMKRWLKAFEQPIPKRKKPEKEAKRAPVIKLSKMPAQRTIACKAFWLMHVEAQRGSGLTVPQYAHAHRIPERRLRKECRLSARTPQVENWRELMHPATWTARRVGSKTRYDLRYEQPLSRPDGAPEEVAVKPPGPLTRRQYTDQQKLAIVADATDPAISVSTIARRHGVTAPMIFRWRAKFGMAPKGNALLMTARVLDPTSRGPRKTVTILSDLLPAPPRAVTVELADGRRVFAPAGSDPELVRQFIANQEATS